MMTLPNVLALLVMLVGLAGIVVPVLPGLFVVWAAAVAWGVERGDGAGWSVVTIASLIYVCAVVLQYRLPGRALRAAGIGTLSLLTAVILGVIGFFAVPIIGGPIGFAAAIYVISRSQRRDHAQAWATTRAALRAIGQSVGVELLAGFAIITTFVVSCVLVRT